MRTLTVAAIMMALVSGSAFAEGSKITKSTLINASKNTLTNTQAIGKNSSANTGSISVKGSKVTIHECYHKHSEAAGCSMSEYVMPGKKREDRQPKTYIVRSNRISLDRCSSVGLWDGEKKYRSWYA